MIVKKVLLVFLFVLTCQVFADSKNADVSENSDSAVVFMYHHFGQSKYPSTNIKLEQFEKHLEYLSKNGYEVWLLSKLVRHIINGENIPPKTVALTMDDAYISIYTEAYPRLKKYNFPFTVFVNTIPVDNKSKNYMTWEQMLEMSSSGAEFANHSLTHDVLLPRNGETKEEWQKRLKHEIEGAQSRLQEKFGNSNNENPKLFSYPFGEYSLQTADFIKSLGYIGIAQTSGPIGMSSDTVALPRFAMSEAYAEMDGFSLKINTLPLPVESVSPLEPLIAFENPPILKLKLKKRVKNMKCYLGDGEDLELNWISDTEVNIQAKNPLKAPRDRYTCTVPSAQSGRWYWYSHLWIVK